MKDNQKDYATNRLGQPNNALVLRRVNWPPEHTLPEAILLHLLESNITIKVALGDFVVLGRCEEPGVDEPTIDLSPYDAQYLGVSRRHVVISTQNKNVMINDLNSTNGSYLNGYLLQPMTSYRLRSGDELSLGKLVMQIKFVVERISEPEL